MLTSKSYCVRVYAAWIFKRCELACSEPWDNVSTAYSSHVVLYFLYQVAFGKYLTSAAFFYVHAFFISLVERQLARCHRQQRHAEPPWGGLRAEHHHQGDRCVESILIPSRALSRILVSRIYSSRFSMISLGSGHPSAERRLRINSREGIRNMAAEATSICNHSNSLQA